MEHLAYWRGQKLDESEAKAIRDIEKFGHHIISVSGSPAWSYSVGNFGGVREPEIIVFGLRSELAVFMINEVIRRAREEGLALVAGQPVDDLLEGGYRCFLRPVQPKWYSWLVGWDLWYHRGSEFEMLQCVWPDKQGFYPWDGEFRSDWRLLQPLLEHDDEGEARMEELLQSLRESDGKCTCSELPSWAYAVGPHTATFTQPDVLAGNAAVTFVAHDGDGWSFTDGSPDPGTPKLACLHHIIDLDASLGAILDLPQGWQAWRESAGGEWYREPSPPESV